MRDALLRRSTFLGVGVVAVLVIAWWALPFAPMHTGQVHIDLQPRGPASGSWQIVLDDEFDGEDLDEGLWVTCYWWDRNGCTNLGNSELEWYLPEQVSTQDGALVLRAERGGVIGWEGATFPYRSGMVTTGRATSDLDEEPRFSFQYGFVEVRARVPRGQGLWAALWLLPITHDSKPEVDIFEVLGDEPAVATAHVHWRGADGDSENTGHRWREVDLSEDYHIYGLEWNSDELIWYIDGIERWRFDDVSIVPAEEMYIIMNLAVGGDFPGPPDVTTPFPAEMLIDYVRVWQEGP